MAKLTKELQTYIVQRLACFKSPSEVADEVLEEFGVKVDRTQVFLYSPKNPELAPKWMELYKATRAEFLKSMAAHGVAHQEYRIAELDDLYRRTKRQGNMKLAGEFLRQSAEELGGKYTNRLEVGIGASQIDPDRLGDGKNLTPEQAEARFALLVGTSSPFDTLMAIKAKEAADTEKPPAGGAE